jgi:hypothetical protein
MPRMTDEKKEAPPSVADEAKRALSRLDELKASVKEENALRLDWLRLARKKIQQDLLHDEETFAEWLATSTPEAKREWQRHQVAVAAMNGLLVNGPVIDPRGVQQLAVLSYQIAEAMMSHRETLKKGPGDGEG